MPKPLPTPASYVFDADGWTFILPVATIEHGGLERYMAALEGVARIQPRRPSELPSLLAEDSTIIINPAGDAVKRRSGRGSEKDPELEPVDLRRPRGTTGMATHYYLYTGGGWAFVIPVNAGFNEITMSAAVRDLRDMDEPTYEQLPQELMRYSDLVVDPYGDAIRRRDGGQVHLVPRPYVPTAEARADEDKDSRIRQRIVAGAVAGGVMREFMVLPDGIDFHADGNHLTFHVAGVPVEIKIGEGPWTA